MVFAVMVGGGQIQTVVPLFGHITMFTASYGPRIPYLAQNISVDREMGLLTACESAKAENAGYFQK